jgi:hypothetical protein
MFMGHNGGHIQKGVLLVISIVLVVDYKISQCVEAGGSGVHAGYSGIGKYTRTRTREYPYP